MIRVTVLGKRGARYDLTAKSGSSLMEVAVRNSVTGIIGECGGACACATCHVYIDDAWADKVGQPSRVEAEMLEFASEVRGTSRLSCQVSLSQDLDGLVVSLPAQQS